MTARKREEGHAVELTDVHLREVRCSCGWRRFVQGDAEAIRVATAHRAAETPLSNMTGSRSRSTVRATEERGTHG